MTFAPTLLLLLRLFSTIRPAGVAREDVYRHLGGTPPDWVDQALEKLLELGLVEQQGNGLVVPLPALKPLAQKMETLAARLNQRAEERDQVMDLVRVIMRGI